VERRIRTYLRNALHLIEQVALLRDAVDWQEVHREADVVLSGAATYADTHEFLTRILKAAGGKHSHLTVSGARQRTTTPPMPTGEMIGTVGYLDLPRLSGGRSRAAAYVTTGTELVTALIEQNPRGWVVNVRRNVGGNMWPMLAVVAPLLPDGVLGHFELPDGRHLTWSLKNGRARLDRKQLARSRNERKAVRPTVILTSSHTASAGEAVVVAFGAHPRSHRIGDPTAGYTTGNSTHLLRDGTRLHISGSYYADHEQHRIDGPIPVDEHVEGRAEVRAAALAWFT
jgi:carboxyl-terminal processing protease